MKKITLSTIGLALLLTIAIPSIGLVSKTTAAAPNQTRECVVINATANGRSLYVYQFSGSKGAPKIDADAELGEALAVYLNLGYEIEQIGPGLLYTLTLRPR